MNQANSVDPVTQDSIIDLQIQELLEVINDCYGYDFRGYAKASQKRRIEHFLNRRGLAAVCEITDRVASDQGFFFEFLNELTISTTELFRDPCVYRDLATHVVPFLKTYPAFKLWHAGCSTGEEVYSLAIFLHEQDLLQRATIYSTDVNRQAIEQAKTGIVPSKILKQGSCNYFGSGLRYSLQDYWHSHHGYSMLDKSLLENVVFSEHNLVTDSAFSEMQLILCRNVLIYFNRELQNHVLELCRDSLSRSGILCLGTKETILFSSVAKDFDVISQPNRIFRKKTRLYA